MPQGVAVLCTVPGNIIAGSPASVAAASGTLADFVSDDAINITVAVELVALTGGTAPGVTFTLAGIDEFGTAYTVQAATALTAPGPTKFNVGPGQTNSDCFRRWRITWATTGAPATATARLSAYGKMPG